MMCPGHQSSTGTSSLRRRRRLMRVNEKGQRGLCRPWQPGDTRLWGQAWGRRQSCWEVRVQSRVPWAAPAAAGVSMKNQTFFILFLCSGNFGGFSKNLEGNK